MERECYSVLLSHAGFPWMEAEEYPFLLIVDAVEVRRVIPSVIVRLDYTVEEQPCSYLA